MTARRATVAFVLLLAAACGRSNPAAPGQVGPGSFLEEGSYTVTVTADAACTGLPAELRSRTFVGALQHSGPSSTDGERFTMTLGGAEFYPTQRMVSGLAASASVSLWVYSLEAFQRWLDDLPVVEKVGETTYLAIMGTATGTRAPGSTSVTTELTGTISYCPQDAENSLFFECAVPPVECVSTRHHLTMSLR